MIIERCVNCGNKNSNKIKLVSTKDKGDSITNNYRCECCGATMEERLSRLWIKQWTPHDTLIYTQRDFSKNH